MRRSRASIAVTSRRARGLKLLLTLAILGGLTAAGIVFGRPYLFPDGWDEATRPYAEAVETARGVEYVEPIAVIAEPTVDYTTRLGGELVGDWSADEPVLRALGLLNGPTTEESATELLADWQDAVYSTVDGQVYTDTGVTGAQLDAEITEEMTAASLDQEFRWSAEQASRTLDDQALTLAEVQRQSSAVLARHRSPPPSSPCPPACWHSCRRSSDTARWPRRPSPSSRTRPPAPRIRSRRSARPGPVPSSPRCPSPQSGRR